MKLNNIRLLVSKFDETFLFYRDVLNFKVTWGNLGENYAQFQPNDLTAIAIFSKEIMSGVLGTSDLPRVSKAQDSAMLVFSVENVDDLYQSMQDKGIKFVTPPTDQPDWGIRVAHVRDPEGTLLELASDLPKEKYSESLKNDFEKHGQD